MAYNVMWGTNHRGYLVYLIDLSLSMGERMSQEGNSKIDDVIETIKEVSEFLIGKCEDVVNMNGEEVTIIKDRFDITILGYNKEVNLLFNGSVLQLDKLLEKKYKTQSPIFDKTNKNEVLPRDLTYTAKGFRTVSNYVQDWICNPDRGSKPIPVPIVIHLTDGYPMEYERSDNEAKSDALNAANELKRISVQDGNVLLFNIHIGQGKDDTLVFPSERPKDSNRQFLFDASSEMSDIFIRRAQNQGFNAQKGSRFMVSNQTDKVALAQLIAFGSSISMKNG